MTPEPLDCDLPPAAVMSAWPGDRPLAALWSGGDSPRARWTILAEPDERHPLESLATLPTRSDRPAPAPAPTDAPPLCGGWIGFITYELGRDLEPALSRSWALRRAASLESPWPRAHFVRCNDALGYDHHRGRWWGIGRARELLARCRGANAPPSPAFQLGPLRSATGRESFQASVGRILEYIRAGDVYQVNLAHRLTGSFSGSARGLFAELAQHARPWYGGYLEIHRTSSGPTRRAVASLSPELFLEYDPHTRTVLTRPMKGTRPGSGSPEELRAAPKDNAELAMIVDLMRNDLGRVCSFGSVRVDQPRIIERHGSPPTRPGNTPTGVLQAVAEVRGTLRPDLDLADLLAAALPGGSVTGAPKVRAMQIIDELEPVPRGPYCGCFGYISDNGHAAFNIAIRTALVSGEPGPGALDRVTNGSLTYSVGAGIVAESDPSAEWRETLDKASVLRHVTRIDDEP